MRKSNSPGNSIIVRKSDLDAVVAGINDLVTLSVAEIISPEQVSRDLRKIYRQLVNLQTNKTGTPA